MNFENVIFGNINDFDKSLLKEIIDYLNEKEINYFYLSGLNEDFGKEYIKNNNFDYFFNFNKIYHVDKSYLDTLSEIDLEIRNNNYKKSNDYIDQYYKIYFLTKLKPNLNNEKTLFIGNDIWTDAYYISEYTLANVILFKSKITFNKEEFNKDLKTINCFENISDFKKIIEEETEFNYSKLKSFAKSYLISKTVGKLDLDLSKIYKKSDK
ncbi:hypothetical protein GW835_03515 [archaeon]|nr:hypothetical protein [archaeon]NCP79606.1 hypothetical protein [archaeon]NCP98323.1 hypothetical protein [archaeon]NCQ07373.1 hypothetical protein [archaeon]NCQ51169.1 hypothetical protein [archaeon]